MHFDKSAFCGVIAPIVNPCREDEGLDDKALIDNANRLLATKIKGLYINGGTGDAEKLTLEERKLTAGILVPAVIKAGKTAIVHVGQTNLRTAVCLAEQASDLGAHAIASIPPRASWQLVQEYYKELTRTGLPVFVYYIPGVTGINAGIDDLCSLLEIPGVIGIKVSDWNVFFIHCLKRRYPDKIVYSGFDEMLVPGLMYGADGCIGTWINLFPEVYTEIYDKVKSGRLDDIAQLQKGFADFLAEGWQYGILSTFEELMNQKGYAKRCFRSPSPWRPDRFPPEALSDLMGKMNELNAAADTCNDAIAAGSVYGRKNHYLSDERGGPCSTLR